jgi:hypothetical protein
MKVSPTGPGGEEYVWAEGILKPELGLRPSDEVGARLRMRYGVFSSGNESEKTYISDKTE